MKKEQKGKERNKRDRRRLERRKDRKDRFGGIERRSKNTRRKGERRKNPPSAGNHNGETDFVGSNLNEDEAS